jgi:elongation factor 1-gamma
MPRSFEQTSSKPTNQPRDNNHSESEPQPTSQQVEPIPQPTTGTFAFNKPQPPTPPNPLNQTYITMSTLYTYPADAHAQKILIAAQFSGAAVKVETKVDAKLLASKSPMGKAPVLETPEGTITQSNAIARYIAGDKLFGANAFEAAQVNQWVDYCLNEVEVPASVWVYPILGMMNNVAEVTAKGKTDLKKAIMTIEKHLKSRTYMVGEAITFADVALATALLLPMKLVLDDKQRKAFPCVVRWFTTLVNQPEFSKVVGDVVLCAKTLVAPESSAAPAKKEKKKADKPKAAAKPAAAAADAPAAPAKKAKHPLELLPKSSLNLDAWKKTYSNVPGEDYYKAMPWFWENLDKEGYSLFTCAYKFNEENKVEFMTSNLIGGFLQRCDEVRKYSFGTMSVIKGAEDPTFQIVGAWVMRGDSIQPLLDCNPDAEYYEWTKLDVNDAEAQKLVGDLWCAEEEVYGKKIYDGKVFK